MNLKKVLILSIFLISSISFAKEPKIYQDGIIQNIGSEKVQGGIFYSKNVVSNTIFTNSNTGTWNRHSFGIISGRKIYFVTYEAKWKWNKEPSWMNGESVKFSVNGDSIFIKDPSGKDVKTKLIRELTEEQVMEIEKNNKQING